MPPYILGHTFKVPFVLGRSLAYQLNRHEVCPVWGGDVRAELFVGCVLDFLHDIAEDFAAAHNELGEAYAVVGVGRQFRHHRGSGQAFSLNTAIRVRISSFVTFKTR